MGNDFRRSGTEIPGPCVAIDAGRMDKWRQIYIMEFTAPFGHAKKTTDLKKRYPNRKAHAVRFDSKGKGGKVVQHFYRAGEEENWE